MGKQKGQTIVRFIESTIYQTLENALEAKRDFGGMLQSELGYNEDNPKYVENLGIIHALEEAIKNQI